MAPDIPTVEELGLPELSFSPWSALFAPKGKPKNLNTAAVDALADPTVRRRFADIGMEVFPRDQQTPQALGALVSRYREMVADHKGGEHYGRRT
jgi:tripartite-type tricarboxylate transporter receptor subunit TctC